MTLSITKLCYYADSHCAECRNLFIGMLNVVMLSVIRLNVFILSVMAPRQKLTLVGSAYSTRIGFGLSLKILNKAGKACLGQTQKLI